MWQAMAAQMGSQALEGATGATEGQSSASTSQTTYYTEAPFGSKDWTDYLPVIVLAVVLVVLVKKGRL